MSDYCASKGGVYNMSESLRMEMKEGNTGINVTTVCPGLVTTGMFDGVKTKYKLLTPPLAPQWMSKRIIQAIETKEREIWTPWFVRGIPILRLLPTDIYDLLQKALGVSDAMTEFKGRNHNFKTKQT